MLWRVSSMHPELKIRALRALQAGVLALSYTTADERDPLDQQVIDELRNVIRLVEVAP